MAAFDATDELGSRHIICPSELWAELDSNQELDFSSSPHLLRDPLNGSESKGVVTSPERSSPENLINQLQLTEQDLSALLDYLPVNEATLPTEHDHLLLNTSDQYNHEEAGEAVVDGLLHFDQEPPRTTGWVDQQAPVAVASSQPQQSSGRATPAVGAASAQVQSRTPAVSTAVTPQVRCSTTKSGTSDVGENYSFKFPDEDVFRLKVMSGKRHIVERKNERDCLLYYQSDDDDHNGDSATIAAAVTKIPMNNFQVGDEGSKGRRLTLKVLQNCAEGVRIYSEYNGNIFVRRLCKAHVYWSTVETRRQEAQKLEHDSVTKVFDFDEFTAHMRGRFERSRENETTLPAVWLSFAQKHGGASGPVNRCLVWARIDPLRAREMVDGANPEVPNTSLGESLGSANIQGGTSI